MNKYSAGIIITVAAVAGALFFFNRAEHEQFGTVIVLNGPSGAGKTSIQQAFQQLMIPTLWIKTGIDSLFDNPMPDITDENMATWQSHNPIRWIEASHDAQGNQVITLLVGEQGQKVIPGMNSAIAAYARNGCNVIVDYIAYKQEWIKDLQEKLADIKTYWVAVDIPLEVLEKREEARGTSPKGHARSHYATVYGDIKYDMHVNSAQHTPQEIAAQIKTLIKK